MRELLWKLESFEGPPGSVWLVTGYDPEMAIDGYSGDQIERHLDLVKEAGFIDSPGSQPMRGVTFRRLTLDGYDFLERSRPPDDEPIPDMALNEIREALEQIKAQLPVLAVSNASKAEIDADLDQIEIETERPTPRRRLMPLFLESLRDNLAKDAGAGAAGVAGALIATMGGILARYFGVL